MRAFTAAVAVLSLAVLPAVRGIDIADVADIGALSVDGVGDFAEQEFLSPPLEAKFLPSAPTNGKASPRSVLDILLGKRQTCSAGYGYCSGKSTTSSSQAPPALCRPKRFISLVLSGANKERSRAD